MQGIPNRSKVHQNNHNPNSKKSARIMGIPNVGLCQRCHDIIEWRKKFRKYKPIKNPTKCGCCSEKKVRSAYHNWCTDCAKASNVCPKCLLNRDIVQQAEAELTQEAIQEMLVQVGMKERVRRKIWRLWENDKVTDEELKAMIFNYNPEAKDEPDDDEDQAAAASAASASPAPAAAAAVARGPPPKPKAAAPKPATAALAPKPASAAADEEDDDDEDFEDDDEDFDDDDEDEDDEAAAAELARQQAAKRGPPPKPKAKPAAAAASTGLEEAVAATTISP